MKVLKFGGTSVGDAKSLKHVVDIVKNSGEQQVVVVSALGGVTNILVEMAEIASARKNNYKEHLKTLEVCHLNPLCASYPTKRNHKFLEVSTKPIGGNISIFIYDKRAHS
jgi:aspartokinase/homoserine dehydrogenase 1